jgi:hypothetical protein
MPDGDFVYIINYQDHGIKFVFSVPMTSKRASAVAWALLEIFTVTGAANNSMPGSHVAFGDDVSVIHLETSIVLPPTRHLSLPYQLGH